MSISPTVANPAFAAYAKAAQQTVEGAESEQTGTRPRFGDVLANAIGGAIDTNTTSEHISLQAASGHGNLQEVVEAVNAAEISLQTVVSIRDRVISAYQEILRMPI